MTVELWQVLLIGLADTWPARHNWTTDQLLRNYGDTVFKISQRSARKVVMKFKDYASYMNLQHDEDPLYIFDDKVLEMVIKHIQRAVYMFKITSILCSLGKLHQTY